MIAPYKLGTSKRATSTVALLLTYKINCEHDYVVTASYSMKITFVCVIAATVSLNTVRNWWRH